MTYGYCEYHELECDYSGLCVNCPHNAEEDAERIEHDAFMEELAFYLDGQPW